MSRGLVDSGTISNVVQALDRQRCANDDWASQSLTTVTQFLIQSDHWHIAPGNQTHIGVALDHQSKLIDRLATIGAIKPLDQVSNADLDRAIRRTKEWAGREQNIEKVRRSLATVQRDDSFEPWFDWLKGNALLVDAERKGHFLDETFEHLTARVLHVEQAELRELRRKSDKLPELKRLLKRDNADFRLLRDSYLCSAIIRGRFHKEISDKQCLHLLAHQIREPLFDGLSREGAKFSVSNTANAVTNIVIQQALWQRSLDNRIKCWVDNIDRVRRAIHRDPQLIDQRPPERVPDAALQIVKSADLQVARQRMAELIDVGIAVGPTVTLAGFTINFWISLIVGVAVPLAAKGLGISGSRILNKWHLRPNHLRKQAAGHVVSRWRRDSGE